MRHLTFLILFLTSLLSYSQFNLNKLKEKLDDVTIPTSKGEVMDLAIDKLLNARKEYNPAIFNYAISFSDNSGLFEVNERFEKHKLILNQVRNYRMKHDDIPAEERADDLNKTGEIFYANSKFKSAELCFKSAMKFYEEDGLKSSEKYATALSNLALLYQTSGRLNKATSTMDELIDLREKINTKTIGYGVALNNKAVLYKDLGRYSEAEELFKQSKSIIVQEKGTESIDFAIYINNLAMLYQTLGQYNQASKLLKEALAIVEKTEDEKSSEYIKLQINLALIYRDQGEIELAEKVYQQAIENKKKGLGSNHPDYAMLLQGLAALNLEMNKFDEVEKLLEQAVSIFEKKLGKEHLTYASGISDLGNFYRTQEKFDKATPLIKSALSIRKEKLGEKHPQYIQSLESVAILDWNMNKILSAKSNYQQVIGLTMEFIDEFFGSMSEVEKTRLWDKFSQRFYRFYAFSSQNYKAHPELLEEFFNIRLKTKALILVSYKQVLESILKSNNQELIKNYEEWVNAKEELAQLYTYTLEELKEQEIDLLAKEREVNELERVISKESKAFEDGFLKTQKYTFEQFKKSLNPSEALVEIVEYQDFHHSFSNNMHYSFFVVTQNNVEYVVLENGSELNSKYLNYYRNSISTKINSDLPYRQYWLKVEEKLKTKTKLYVTLDGVYSQINLNNLFDGENYLIEKHEFVFLNHSKDYLKLNKNTPLTFKTASLIGNPNFMSDDISALPGTAKEIAQISSLLKNAKCKVEAFQQNEATEENFKKVRNNVIHVATHGFFMNDVDPASTSRVFGIQTVQANQNPLHRSGLLLAGVGNSFEKNFSDHNANNGVLTAYEIKNLNLSDVGLVVLSACETGLGDVKVGEGVYGMQRALQEAGVGYIIMSLWKVDDKATAELMISFYKNLIVNKMSIQASYRKAMLQTMKIYPDPHYWSAFVLVNG